MNRIVLIGGGQHAEVIADIVEQQGRDRIVGITDTRRSVGDRFLDYAVIGVQTRLQDLMDEHGVTAGIVCIGDNYSREEVVASLRAQVADFVFATAVHPTAALSPRAEIGEGCVLMPGCAVNTGARVGRHCIINTRSSLEHGSTMGDYSSLSPGVTTGGSVTLGHHSALALGVNVLERVRVGSNVVVGSGSLVTKDTEDDVLMYGSPARVIRKRVAGEPWLASDESTR